MKRKTPTNRRRVAPKRGAKNKPTVFDQGLADEICRRIADGESLRSVCKLVKMPTKATAFTWRDQVPAFADQYARAREDQADAFVDDIVEISDRRRVRADDKRVMIDARKWAAGKQRPKKYGEKVAIVGGGADDSPVKVNVDFRTDIADRIARAAAAVGARPSSERTDDAPAEGTGTGS